MKNSTPCAFQTAHSTMKMNSGDELSIKVIAFVLKEIYCHWQLQYLISITHPKTLNAYHSF